MASTHDGWRDSGDHEEIWWLSLLLNHPSCAAIEENLAVDAMTGVENDPHVWKYIAEGIRPCHPFSLALQSAFIVAKAAGRHVLM